MTQYLALLAQNLFTKVLCDPVDKAFMSPMKAMYVPFYLLYGNMICYQRLQSDRPKYLLVLVEVSLTQKHIEIVPCLSVGILVKFIYQ